MSRKNCGGGQEGSPGQSGLRPQTTCLEELVPKGSFEGWLGVFCTKKCVWVEKVLPARARTAQAETRRRGSGWRGRVQRKRPLRSFTSFCKTHRLMNGRGA